MLEFYIQLSGIAGFTIGPDKEWLAYTVNRLLILSLYTNNHGDHQHQFGH